MKRKIYILLVVVLLIGMHLLYSFPIQKHLAEKTLKEYMSIQGCSSESIKSKKISKDYKIGGYNIYIVYKDDLDFTYEYHYFPGGKNLTDSMICEVYTKQNISVNVNKEKIKYPPISVTVESSTS